MSTEKQVKLPDLGLDTAHVAAIAVSAGDAIQVEHTLITLESDKATMELPSPYAGVVKEVLVHADQEVKAGDVIMIIASSDEEIVADDKEIATDEEVVTDDRAGISVEKEPAQASVPETARHGVSSPVIAAHAQMMQTEHEKKIYASPSVRRLARELGVDLGLVRGSGRKGRVRMEDVRLFANQDGSPTLAMPPADLSRLGAVEQRPLGRIKRLTGQKMQQSWSTVPQVTQFDEADITELEEFRKVQQIAATVQGGKLTLIAFITKAVVAVLKRYPEFNASLSADGQDLILKQYFHIGIAVNTAEGLLVPVIRDVDKKGVLAIAAEIGAMSQQARERNIKAADLAGGCFTISSLGGIGGLHFTPIVNVPEVAILGVSRAQLRPVYREDRLLQRLILPFALSYDHRVIDGVAAAQFTQALGMILADIRTILL